MSGHHQRSEDDLAYGGDYSGNRGYYDQQDGQEGDRGISDTFRKYKAKYDQRHGNRPPQDFGYGNTSLDTVGSHKYDSSGYGGGGSSQQYGQSSQPSQSAYPGGRPQQQGQGKPGLPNQVLGGLLGSITSIGQDVEKIIGGGKSSHGQRPPQGMQDYQHGYDQGWQPGLQTNLQTQVPSSTSRNRFDSTFPGPRPGNDVKWYVDGCSYFWAVSQALENARQSIWILDWWLSPELYLRRPPATNEEWRLDRVLQRAATRGVKINVIVYKEVTQVLTLSSSHTKHALEDLSPNIAVFRHPDHLPDAQTAHSSIVSALQGLKLDSAGTSKLGPDALKGIYGINDDVILYWAHHEKLCLIDGTIAFMGGLDLCFGRWDLNHHPIADAHPSDLNKIVFPGQDFNNARVMDFSDVDHPFLNKLDRTKSSRMGWSDISICLRGPCVGDLMHHFVDRWNFIYDEKYNVRQDKRYQRLPVYPEHRADEGPGALPQVGQQEGQAGQLSQPFAAHYTPPPWHATNQPPETFTQGTQTQPYQTGYGQQAQGQQGFPPPPPGPPPLQGTYGQQQSQNYPQSSTSQGGPTQSHTVYGQPSGGYQSTQPGEPQAQYSSTQQQANLPIGVGYQDTSQTPQTQHGISQPSYAQSNTSTQPGQYDTSHQYSQQQQSHPPTGPQPGPGSYNTGQQQPYSQQGSNTQPGVGPLQQQSGYHPPATQTGAQGGQSQFPTSQQQPQLPQPPVSTQPGQTQYGLQPQNPSQQPSQGQYQNLPLSTDPSQRPHTPNTQETQMVAQQYTAYTAPNDPAHAGPPGSSGPAELGGPQSSQYQAYHGQPTARGLSGPEEYESGYGGERGLGSEYEQGDPDYNQGGERGLFGSSKPGSGPGRFDRYKEEAMRFRNEGKIFGTDVHSIENKVQGKVADYSGGRFGRPSSRSSGPMSCQLVRSCTKWSNGTNTEHSVQNAYIDLIQNAKHFIYIENQFFITATGDRQKPIKNLIGKAIVERILRAARNQEAFKIIVNIPSVPAFAGDLVEDQALGTRAIMEFQYNSICRGGNSIMEEVARANVNPMDYIRFYNLRNYDRINHTHAQQHAEQHAGIGYDDARKQWESRLGSGYAGYGEMGAQTGQAQGYGTQPGQTQLPAPPQQGQYQQPGQAQQSQYQQTGQVGQQPGQQGPYSASGQQGQYQQPIQQGHYQQQTGQGPQQQAGTQGQNLQQGQYQQPGTQGQTQFPPPPQQGQYSQSGQQGQPSFPPPPQQGQTRAVDQPGQYQPPGSQGQYSQPAQYGPYGYQAPGQSRPSQQQGPQGGQQYQQAAQNAPTGKADQWDSVASCYMLGGQDIRTVPWSGPPEAELDAFVSEEVYIHTKLMIVDDQTVICGSANLNDRSMLGTHDSEIALVISDPTPVQSTMGSRPWQASRFAASLRRQLFRKHLGLLRPQDMQTPNDNFMPLGPSNTYDWGSPEDNIVSDPLSDTFQSLWNTRARTNTEVFRKAFRAVPDDNITTWTEYKEFYEYYFTRATEQAVGKDEFRKKSRVEYGHVVREDFPGGVRELKELLSQVRGTLVEMPLCFLQSEDLAREGVSFNALTAEIYT